MAELEARITADASDLVSATRTAGRAFDRFTTELSRDSQQAERAFSGLQQSAQRAGSQIQRTATQARTARGNFGQVATVAQDLGRSVQSATSAFDGLGVVLTGPVGVGLRVLQTAVPVVVGGLQAAAAAAGAFSLAAAGIGVEATRRFARFESAFAQVRTLIDESQVDVEALRGGVRGLAVTFGEDLLEATRAAYDAISAGVAPAQTVLFLETAFKAAAAGASDVNAATDLLTSTLNAYGVGADQVNRVSDVFFATVKDGKTTIDELAASVGRVVPVAAASGVSLEEVGAALATVTATGLSTQQTATQLAGLIQQIVRPSKEAGEALASIGVTADVLRRQGLEEVIRRVNAALAAGQGEITDFFTAQEGLIAATTLASTNFGRFEQSLANTRNSLGATDEAAQKTIGALSRTFGQFTSAVNDAFVELGQAISPLAQEILPALTEFVVKLQGEFTRFAAILREQFAGDVSAALADVRTDISETEDVIVRALAALSGAFRAASRAVELLGPPVAQIAGNLRELTGILGGLDLLIRGTLLTGISLFASQLSTIASAAGIAAQALGQQQLGGALVELGNGLQGVASITGTLGLEQAAVGANELANASANAEATFREVERTAQRTAAGLASVSDNFDELSRRLAASNEAARGFDAIGDAITAAVAATGDQIEGLGLLDGALARTSGRTEDLRLKTSAAAQASAELETSTREQAAAQDRLTSATQTARAATEEQVQSLKELSELLQGLSAGTALDGTVSRAIERLGSSIALTTDEARELERTLGQSFSALTSGSQRFTNAATTARLFAADAGGLVSVIEELGGSLDQVGRQQLKVVLSEFQRGGATVQQFTQSLEDLQSRARDLARNELDELIQKGDELIDRFSDAELLRLGALGTEIDDATNRLAEFLNTAATGTPLETTLINLEQAFNEGKLSADEFRAGLDSLFGALRGTDQAFVDADTSSRLFTEGQDRLIPKIEELGRRLDDTGRAKLQVLLDGFRSGRDSAAEFRRGLQQLANEVGSVASQAQQAGRAIEQAFAGANQAIAAFGRPGSIQFSRTPSGGSSVFGIGNRVTGSSNFQSALEAQLGEALGLGPKALRSRAGRSGGLEALARSVLGVGRFASGGVVQTTGPGLLEAGEVVLNQRGVGRLGEIFAQLLSNGGAQAVTQNFNNTFSVQAPATEQLNARQLALLIQPELRRSGLLAANKSPIQ